MKKIILSMIIASSFSISGDVSKCEEALNKTRDYDQLSRKEYAKGSKREVTIQELIYSDFTMAWYNVMVKECKGILGDDNYKRLVAKKPQAFKERGK